MSMTGFGCWWPLPIAGLKLLNIKSGQEKTYLKCRHIFLSSTFSQNFPFSVTKSFKSYQKESAVFPADAIDFALRTPNCSLPSQSSSRPRIARVDDHHIDFAYQISPSRPTWLCIPVGGRPLRIQGFSRDASWRLSGSFLWRWARERASWWLFESRLNLQ